VLVLAGSLFPFLLGGWWLGDLVTSLRLQLGVLAALVVIVAAPLRGWIVAAVGAAALAANAAVVAPAYTGGQERPADGARLLVGHVNMQAAPGSLEALRAALTRERPAVFVVLEPDPGLAAGLGRGIDGYRAYRPAGVSGGRVVVLARSRIRLVAPGVAGLPEAAAAFDVPFDGRTVHVLALHTISPLSPGRAHRRDRALRAAARWAAGRPTTVVLGDFNAVPWSSIVDEVARAGRLVDSTNGRRPQASWPGFAGVLGIPIDQLLHSRDLTVTARETHGGFGSTHRSLWVRLALSAS